MPGSPTSDEVLDTVTTVPPDQQEDLVRVVRQRLADQRRAQLVADVPEAQAEFARGELRPAMVDEIVREISR